MLVLELGLGDGRERMLVPKTSSDRVKCCVMARVDIPIQPGKVGEGSRRCPNPTGKRHEPLRLLSMSQSDKTTKVD